jgi:AMMECR1 domain-containing protein
MASTAHCAYCFETLVAALDDSGQLSLNEVEKLYDRYQSADGQSPASNKSEKYPLFVTLNTISKSGDKRLRGCIGTFEAQPLDVGLKTYTLAA